METLFESFNERIESLQSLLHLHSQYKLQTQEYNNLISNIDALETRAVSIRNSLLVQEKQLQHSKNVVIPRLKHVKMSVEHALRNVPESLREEIEENETMVKAAEKRETEVTAKKSNHENVKRGGGAPRIEALSVDEFNSLPKYLVGRATLEKLNSALELVNGIYQDMYTMIHTSSLKLTREQKDRLWAHKQCETEETAGKPFITESDVKDSGFKMDNVGRALFAILRHLGRIKEVRGGGHVRMLVA
ncbi:hypothetical protein HK098_005423 [Nowakowskiella sp. JEL0407]|nr:hypothetical protein HK098_005423 [Nowakowskiella sp. JEL0407]